MKKSLPMTTDEFNSGGVEGDVLETTFVDGTIVKEQQWMEIRARANITKPHLEAAIERAVDNLAVKVDFLQEMSAPKAIAVRMAEAACGCKWTASTPASEALAALKERLPAYSAALDELGLNPEMDSSEMLKQVNEKHVCAKKAAKAVLAALADGDMAAAAEKKGGKSCITL